MKLVYQVTGGEVQVGDVVDAGDGAQMRVHGFALPVADSLGSVFLRPLDSDAIQNTYPPEALGMEWVE